MRINQINLNMRNFWLLLSTFVFVNCTGQNNPTLIMNDSNNIKLNSLTPEEQRVIIHKGTEAPYTGIFTDNKEQGTYTCKQCNQELFSSESKFNSRCGWPSFDDAIPGTVKEILDADGHRTEIVCAKCGGHLGHVFKGEGFTDKDTRHCVNSISLNFIPASSKTHLDTAIFASGCFWGTEYYLKQLPGVKTTEVGYIGGTVKNPSYKEVCTGRTGHAEATRVLNDSDSVSYETLAKYFFETHDPTQVDRQGPDIGTQYRSEVFYLNEAQKETTEKLIKILEGKGYKIATKVTAASPFYKAETYHQDYYNNTGGTPYCHKYTKKF